MSTDPSDWKPGRRTISIYFSLCAAGLISVGLFGIAGSEPGRLRLIVSSAELLLSGLFGILAWQTVRNERLANGWNKFATQKIYSVLIFLTSFVLLTSWVIIWTPLESFGAIYYYLLALYSGLIWLTCASCAALFLLLATRFGLQIRQGRENLAKQRAIMFISATALVIFGLLAWVATSRVIGMKPHQEDFWYGAGAPVLAFQILWALLIGAGLCILIKKWTAQLPALSRHMDLLLFLLVWAASAWLWAAQPVRPDFLITEPVAPNFEMYPDYDARNYDIMSQFALLGQGINNRSFFDRVLYPAFLLYLHTLAGQDYAHVMALQAAIFALLPALIYLIGKRIHSRAAGLGLGILLALRGASHIDVGSIIETAHPKHMLTEYPTTVLLVLATFLLIKWAQAPDRHWPSAALASTVIALATLLRPHPLALFPVMIALGLVLYSQNTNRAGSNFRLKTHIWLGVSGLMAISAVASILPWVQFSGQNISIIDLYLDRINTIIQQRYPQNTEPQGALSQNSVVSLFNARVPALEAHGKTALLHVQIPEKPVLAFAADNFLNNLVTSVQILPTTPFNIEARVVVKKTENFWKPYWDGSLTPWARLLIPINLLFIAIGIGTAWKNARLSGIIPLLVMLTYYAVNALGRTSGGRYLVPVDWVIIIYYMLGIIAASQWALAFFWQPTLSTVSKEDHLEDKPNWKGRALKVLLIAVVSGSLLPLSQIIHPRRFQSLSASEMTLQLTSQAQQTLGLSSQDLEKFLLTSNAVALTGRGLYPRQFNKDEGLDISIYNFYHSQPYPRTLFTLLGPKGEQVIVIPSVDPVKIANSSDVIVIGCAQDGFVRAWAVVRMSDNSIVRPIPAGIPLTCPLPDPVCDNNKNCR